MIEFVTSETPTIVFCIVVIAFFTGFVGFLIGRIWDNDSGGNGGDTWDVPDYPPIDWIKEESMI